MNYPTTITQETWQQINLFFMEQDNIYETLRKLHQQLTEAKISYVVIGGMALALHGYRRLTEDIDLLMSPEGLGEFCKTFKNSATGVRIEIITAGKFPGDGKPKAVSFPNPQEVAVELGGLMVINLESLIELKLASGLSAPDHLKDLADVQELIRVLNLPSSIIEQLDPSVQQEYFRLWSALQK